jgi:hypothetical protein
VDEDRFNAAVRKFLRTVGVTSQREIENAVRAAIAAGKLPEPGKVEARMTLRIPAIGLEHEIEDSIEF